MEIKGSAVRTIPEFVKTRFPEKYDEWFSLLPPPSRAIFSGFIKPSDWYNLYDAAVMPTEAISKIAFGGDLNKASWECGRFSAEATLKGMYRFFLMAVPSRTVVTSGGRILTTFYKPVQFKVAESGAGHVKIHVTQVDDRSGMVENRIAGWIEKALEIQGLKAARVDISQSLAKGDPVVEISIIWS
ncbi:MAG: hypothetical protein A2Y87_07420 [Bacteroidetes bacterium RBG_13_46_8]|nr:MAG: hypothetical protein A2Y87_07420 [Bacteroidetes bacterium RBG_13_46_8]